MFIYLFKSILCLLVLWGFYKLALEQQVAHHFKRFFLLGSVIFAIVLPLITLSYTVEAVPPVTTQVTQLSTSSQIMNAPSTSVAETIDWLPILLGFIYSLGVLFFGFRFARNPNHLRHKVQHNERIKTSTHTTVLLSGKKEVPHSFLQYIFLPKTAYIQNRIAPEIMAHEQAHVSQKHSWDILFIEFLQVVFWFNPVLVLVKKNMALNHEFLADQTALIQNHNIKAYTDLLFTYSGGAHHTALSSPINYSLTRPPFRRAKKRILMLSQSFSARKMATRIAFFIPILALCVYFFNQDIVAKSIYPDQDIDSVSAVSNENGWIKVYVKKDQSITVNGQKTVVQHLTQTLTELTHYNKIERKEHLKLILNLDPRISWDFIGEIADVVQDYGVYSMIGHSIAKVSNAQSENDPRVIDYNHVLKLPVLEQLQSYDFKVTFDLLGKGQSDDEIKKSLKQALQVNTKGQKGSSKRSTSPLQSKKQVDLFELKKGKLFINGNRVKMENLETELKQRYGKYSKKQLANQIVVNLQTSDPETDRHNVNIIRTALSRIGIDQFVWSASKLAHAPENSPENGYYHLSLGTVPTGLPEVYAEPEKYVNKMQEMNTTFFYKGKKISAERTKIILKENKKVRVVSDFSSSFGENPVMQLGD